jgi:hypothetical protein
MFAECAGLRSLRFWFDPQCLYPGHPAWPEQRRQHNTPPSPPSTRLHRNSLFESAVLRQFLSFHRVSSGIVSPLWACELKKRKVIHETDANQRHAS